MKQLPDRNYAVLTGAERATVALAALARDDNAEPLRLRTPARANSADHADRTISDRMDALLTMTLATECDLRGWAAVACLRSPGPTRHWSCSACAPSPLPWTASPSDRALTRAHLRGVGVARHELVACWLDHPAPAPTEAHIDAELRTLRDYWQKAFVSRAGRVTASMAGHAPVHRPHDPSVPRSARHWPAPALHPAMPPHRGSLRAESCRSAARRIASCMARADRHDQA